MAARARSVPVREILRRLVVDHIGNRVNLSVTVSGNLHRPNNPDMTSTPELSVERLVTLHLNRPREAINVSEPDPRSRQVVNHPLSVTPECVQF
jgi:hypothetical protein